MSRTGFYTHPDCQRHDMGRGHPECPERLSAIRDRLLVSGVLADQAEEIVSAFGAVGLYSGRRREQEGWVAMEFLRSESCEGV